MRVCVGCIATVGVLVTGRADDVAGTAIAVDGNKVGDIGVPAQPAVHSIEKTNKGSNCSGLVTVLFHNKRHAKEVVCLLIVLKNLPHVFIERFEVLLKLIAGSFLRFAAHIHF